MAVGKVHRRKEPVVVIKPSLDADLSTERTTAQATGYERIRMQRERREDDHGGKKGRCKRLLVNHHQPGSRWMPTTVHCAERSVFIIAGIGSEEGNWFAISPINSLMRANSACSKYTLVLRGIDTT
ncbi:hypothetical protein A2U01_0003735 [Trifolium medium]|uniref:Uncharacterized protein n=1 Tax=Trifolium medium TaxID=97028 RepID=A0A392M663_9FABA|nr:hypothetical protein [Trifolium medium]